MTWWKEERYLAGKEIDEYGWLALIAFDMYDGHGDPLDGWVKHFPSERRHSPLTDRAVVPEPQ